MRKKILAILIVAILAMSSLAPAIVSADTYVKSGYACKSGSNIYFAFTSSKKSTPIYKFNVKTGQRTKVYPKGQSSLKVFKNLNVLGNMFIARRVQLAALLVLISIGLILRLARLRNLKRARNLLLLTER